MKRILIPFIAAFGLSLGVGTGVAIMRAPKATQSKAATKGSSKIGAKAVVPKSAVAAQAPHADADSAVRSATVAQTAQSSQSGTTRDDAAAKAQPAAGAATKIASAASTPVKNLPTANDAQRAKAAPEPMTHEQRSSEQTAPAGRSVGTTPTPSTAPGAPVATVSPPAPKGASVSKVASTKGVVADTVVSRRLAQVFGAMQAKDAARVLEQMDDADVRTILASLNNKQQAAILEAFPTERAATIARATLRSRGGA